MQAKTCIYYIIQNKNKYNTLCINVILKMKNTLAFRAV